MVASSNHLRGVARYGIDLTSCFLAAVGYLRDVAPSLFSLPAFSLSSILGELREPVGSQLES